MLKVFFSLSVFFSSCFAYADHPIDSDPLVNIGIGTQLVIKRDLNFRPNVQSFFFNKSCYIKAKDESSEDRILEKDEVLTVTKAYFGEANSWANVLEFDRSSIAYLICYNYTIGEFKTNLQSYISVVFPRPIRL
ncbi:MAG: hypothetical protein QE271_04755 [Bacteriovoracaceae bacterium]|nr:hypothetical protein [Bacteriovoracaceae bacterium]